jgi:hypothetical protein
MITKKTIILIGLLLIVAALIVTGSTYKETGNLSNGVAMAAGIVVTAGLALVFFSGYMKK